MSGTSASDQTTVPPTYQDFHWIFGSTRRERCADFIELARDISAGVTTCLQIIHSSDLVREINQDAELEQVTAPAVGKTDCGALFRLSVAATALLRKAADEQISVLNER